MDDDRNYTSKQITKKYFTSKLLLQFLELVRNLQWLLEIRTYTNKNRNHINASSHISLKLLY